MKQTWTKFFSFLFAIALLAPASLLAQKDEKDKEGKEKSEKKEAQQIIITRKNDEKVIVEVNGDKITVNGKPLDEFKDDDVNVRVRKYKDVEGLTHSPGWNYNYNDNFGLFNEDANHAVLGVTTEKADQGVEIESVTKESGAAKSGLKTGDIIMKVDDKKIEDPDDLTKAIRSHKPGDKVSITYLRDKKEQKTTAELTKWKGAGGMTFNGENFKMDMGDFNMPKIRAITPYGQNWSWSGGSPKLGLSVQDTDDGKGVKVIDVDEESNAAKAGIKEDDVITEVDGKAINSTDEIAKIIRDSKEKKSVTIKFERKGKAESVQVNIPRKIKTADL